MQRLILIRHGQASFGSDHYDQLSDKGYQQCEILGQWLSTNGPAIESMVHGDLARHRQSASSIQQHFPVQHVTEDKGLNEFPFHELLHCFAAQHPQQEQVIHWDRSSVASTFRLLRETIQQWQSGRLDLSAPDSPESWDHFTQRVEQAFQSIQHTEKDALVVASGGSIAWYLTRVLQCPLSQWFELNLQINNSATSEVIIGKRGPKLLRFNSIAHLQTAEYQHLITHS